MEAGVLKGRQVGKARSLFHQQEVHPGRELFVDRPLQKGHPGHQQKIQGEGQGKPCQGPEQVQGEGSPSQFPRQAVHQSAGETQHRNRKEPAQGEKAQK